MTGGAERDGFARTGRDAIAAAIAGVLIDGGLGRQPDPWSKANRRMRTGIAAGTADDAGLRETEFVDHRDASGEQFSAEQGTT